MVLLLVPVLLPAVAAPGVGDVAKDGGGGGVAPAAGLEISGGGLLVFLPELDGLLSSINVGVPPGGFNVYILRFINNAAGTGRSSLGLAEAAGGSFQAHAYRWSAGHQ